MAKKRIFISDLHLGSGLATDWFKKDIHGPQMVGFLDYIAARPNEYKELILCGDCFETWVCKLTDTPIGVPAIREYHKDVFAAFKKVAEALDNGVAYVRGNHDSFVKTEDMEGTGMHVIESLAWSADRIRAEHGHAYTMFNAPDPINDPINKIPLGYYISRMASITEDYDGPGFMMRFADNWLEAVFTSTTFSECIIDGLAEELGYSMNDKFTMPGNIPDITVGQVREKYKDLWDQWYYKGGHTYRLKSLQAEAGGSSDFNYFADSLCEDAGYKIVVFGHTHYDDIDEDTWWCDDRIYVNTGCWISSNEENYTFIEVEKGDRYVVTANHWKNGNISQVSKEDVCLVD